MAKRKYLYRFSNHNEFLSNPINTFPNVSLCYNNNFELHFNEKKYNLKHWFCGEDNLVSSKWVDRINPNVKWTAVGNPIHEDNYYRVGITDNFSNYDIKNGMYFKADSNFLNLGNYYKITIEFKILEGYNNTYEGTNMQLVDFGSIRSCTKGTSCSLGRYNENPNLWCLSQNLKMLGLDTSMGPNRFPTGRNTKNSNIVENEWYIGEWICTKYDNNNSVQACRINNSPILYSTNPHINVSLSNLDAIENSGTLGIYIIGGGCVKSNTSKTYQYSSKVLIRNIWIYEEIV